MTRYLGARPATGILDPNNPYVPGAYTVTFGPDDLYPDDFEIFHMALTGPGGRFLVYIDTQLYSASIRGDLNEYNPAFPMYVRRGQSIFFYWNLATGTAPRVWLYSRSPGEI